MPGNRTTVEAPRADESRGWEVFVREAPSEPLRHVGSVEGPSADVAGEHAEQLFGWSAETLWLCPTDETRRYTSETLDGREEGTDT
jgi:rSAM-partnered protein